jgi:UDP-galactose transporter B1
MFEHINKWVTILSFIYSFFTGNFSKMVTFATDYPDFKFDIILVSVLATVGQIFVYRMIKQFKQHIVPFVITTRKIFTVVLSIFFYHHVTTIYQMLAIALVFVAASYEYLS